MRHETLTWGPNPEGGTNALGWVIPTGWAWQCDCGSRGLGYPTEFGANAAAIVHRLLDTYVYTWLGDTPDELVSEVRRRGALARVGYVWGGMNWNVTVTPNPDRTLRDASGRRPFVRLVWGDVVTVVGYEPDVALVIWRSTTGEILD